MRKELTDVLSDLKTLSSRLQELQQKIAREELAKIKAQVKHAKKKH